MTEAALLFGLGTAGVVFFYVVAAEEEHNRRDPVLAGLLCCACMLFGGARMFTSLAATSARWWVLYPMAGVGLLWARGACLVIARSMPGLRHACVTSLNALTGALAGSLVIYAAVYPSIGSGIILLSLGYGVAFFLFRIGDPKEQLRLSTKVWAAVLLVSFLGLGAALLLRGLESSLGRCWLAAPLALGLLGALAAWESRTGGVWQSSPKLRIYGALAMLVVAAPVSLSAYRYAPKVGRAVLRDLFEDRDKTWEVEWEKRTGGPSLLAEVRRVAPKLIEQGVVDHRDEPERPGGWVLVDQQRWRFSPECRELRENVLPRNPSDVSHIVVIGPPTRTSGLYVRQTHFPAITPLSACSASATKPTSSTGSTDASSRRASSRANWRTFGGVAHGRTSRNRALRCGMRCTRCSSEPQGPGNGCCAGPKSQVKWSSWPDTTRRVPWRVHVILCSVLASSDAKPLASCVVCTNGLGCAAPGPGPPPRPQPGDPGHTAASSCPAPSGRARSAGTTAPRSPLQPATPPPPAA